MREPAVSVVVPCFNAEKYLRECIDSVVSQTLKNLEIICINDGSSDGTIRILRDYASKDKRIRIIDKKNTGYGDSVNIGIRESRGKYIGIVESDDFIEPEMYQKLFEIAERLELDVARGGYSFHAGNNDKIEEEKEISRDVVLRPRDHLKMFVTQPSIWAAVYRKDWLTANDIRFQMTPGASYQDISFNFKAYALAERFMKRGELFYHYRVDNSTSSRNSREKKFCVCDEWKEIYNFVKKRNFSDLYQIMPVAQFGNYRWNCNRLSSEERVSFMKKWSDELRKEDLAGHIKWKNLDKKSKKRLWMIKNFPMIYFLVHGKRA